MHNPLFRPKTANSNATLTSTRQKGSEGGEGGKGAQSEEEEVSQTTGDKGMPTLQPGNYTFFFFFVVLEFELRAYT
jgi:hypothetical protein